MAFANSFDSGRAQPSLAEKLWSINWGLVLLLTLIAGVGFATLYSAANGSWHPWAEKQAIRYGVAVILMLGVAMIDVRFWLRYHAAYIFYAVAFLLLIIVQLHGRLGMGAQRWIDLGIIQLQPSELMKIAQVLVLARYFHGIAPEDIGRPHLLIVPALLVLVPAAMVLKQPDLGTAMMLVMAGGAMFFLAGVRWWKFVIVIAGAAGSAPILWRFLKDYQKNRIYTFLDPESDPLGAGYHSLQSKIAIGSGGIFGKGFMQGTQSHLSFLPEKQTDFIFTIIGEEFGFVGAVAVMALLCIIVLGGMRIAFRCKHQFGRLVAFGLAMNFFLYVFVNIAMVMGVIPVGGVPLPLVSHGGSAMFTTMVGFGLLLSVAVHHDAEFPSSDDG